MKLPRRTFLHLAAGAAALPAVSRIARAQAYPTRPVRIVVGVPPSGTLDILARVHGSMAVGTARPAIHHREPAGRRHQYRHRGGRTSPPDGYTLLLITPSSAINATLYDKLNFNFIRDIAPVAGIIRVPLVMVLNPSVPAKTVPEFIAYAKANPGKTQHGICRQRDFGPRGWRAVQNDGRRRYGPCSLSRRGPALTDLLGGQVQVMFVDILSSVEHIRAGKLRALAVTTATRSEALPRHPDRGRFRARL